ncbi:hypothetical protein SRB17_06860 [Streptomyces sp. RB17]|nr:hypothetical protein [Streptomyces sp. RB17]
MFIPHCRAQYGQWVGVEAIVSMPPGCVGRVTAPTASRYAPGTATSPPGRARREVRVPLLVPYCLLSERLTPAAIVVASTQPVTISRYDSHWYQPSGANAPSWPKSMIGSSRSRV